MAPVYHALKAQPGLEPLVLLTGQHREQLVQALSQFEVLTSRFPRSPSPNLHIPYCTHTQGSQNMAVAEVT